MKYAIIQCSNGNFSIVAEGYTDIEQAKVRYHGAAQALLNAPDVVTAKVAIVDEQLNIFGKYSEYIDHTPAPAPANTPAGESAAAPAA